jgi:GNAT superfamily N-acetyltransferase
VDGHDVALSLHYDPSSAMHAYLKILEAPNEKGYIAGTLFNEIKRRVFQRAAAEGIVLADGTSWGFPTTRMDHYMHTLRIAVGLEHEKTLQRIGTLLASVVKELKTHPEDFLQGTEVVPLSPGLTKTHGDEILALDRLIPHDPAHPTPLSTYQLKDWDYSFALRDQGKLTAMALAYPRAPGEVYLSKAATDPSAQGKGHFKRLLHNVRDRARAEGHEKIVLQTSASPRNERVVRTYEKCGFEVTGLKATIGPDGWPLVLVEMGMPVNGQAAPPGKPFAALPDALYAEVKEGGDLSAVERAAAERGIPLNP